MPVESHLQECKCVSLKTHTCYCRTHTCSHPSISRWLSIPLPDSVWSNLRNREKGGPVQRCVAVARGSWDVPARIRAGRRCPRCARGTSQPCGRPIVRHTCDMAAYAVVFNEISISKSDKISDIERRERVPDNAHRMRGRGEGQRGSARAGTKDAWSGTRKRSHRTRSRAVAPDLKAGTCTVGAGPPPAVPVSRRNSKVRSRRVNTATMLASHRLCNAL